MLEVRSHAVHILLAFQGRGTLRGRLRKPVRQGVLVVEFVVAAKCVSRSPPELCVCMSQEFIPGSARVYCKNVRLDEGENEDPEAE